MKRKLPNRLSSFLSRTITELEARENPANFWVGTFGSSTYIGAGAVGQTAPATFPTLSAALAAAATNNTTAPNVIDNVYLPVGDTLIDNTGGSPILVNDKINLVGSGKGVSFLKPANDVSPLSPSYSSTDAIIVQNLSRLNISNLTYDGTGKNDQGIQYQSAFGDISNIAMKGVGYDAGGGSFNGTGIYVNTNSFVKVTDSSFEVEGRNAIRVSNGTLSATNSSFMGVGAGTFAQYGIEASGSAKVTASGDTFTFFQGSETNFGSSALLLYATVDANKGLLNPEAYITRSDITNNSVGVIAGLDGVTDNSSLLLAYNNFSANDNLAVQAGTKNAGVINARFNWWNSASGAAQLDETGAVIANGSGNEAVSGPVYGGVPLINVTQPLQAARGVYSANGATYAIGSSNSASQSKIMTANATLTGSTLLTAVSSSTNGLNKASRVASGDVNGDGVNDIIIGADTGLTATVEVFDGKTGTPVNKFTAFPGTVGVNVALGDVNGDGKLDIIAGQASGAANVTVFNGVGSGNTTPAVIRSFTARTSTVGVSVAAGDFNGDGRDDVFTGSGGLAQIYDAKNLVANAVPAFNAQFQPYEGSSGAFNVAAGDVNGDGIADAVVSKPGTLKMTRFTIGSLFTPVNAPSIVQNVINLSGLAPSTNIGVHDLNNDGYSDIMFTVTTVTSLNVINGKTNAQTSLLTAAYPGNTNFFVG